MRRVLDPLARMGASVDRRGGRPPAAHARGRARPDPDRLRAAGRLGPAQVGRAARGPCGARRHHGDREGGDAATTPSACCGISAPRSPSSRTAPWPPDHAARASRNWRPRRCRGAGRPFVCGFPLVAALIVPGSDIAARRRDDQPAAHRPDRDAARDGRDDRSTISRAATAARTWRICGCAPRRCTASRCRPERAPSMIDEYPMLAVAAAFAEGTR